MKPKSTPKQGNRFIDKRSKLTDSSFHFVIDMRHPIKGKPASWKKIIEELYLNYDITLSEQGLLKIFKRYKDIFIINSLSKSLLEKRSHLNHQEYYIKRHNQPDLKFKGLMVLQVKDSSTTYTIYATAHSNMILEKQTQLVHDATNALLINDVIDFFGWDDLAKDLYEKMNIQKYIEVK